MIFAYSILLILYGVINSIFLDKIEIIFLSPIFFGGIIFVMGIMSLNKDFVLFGQHGATTLSLIAFISSLPGFVNIINDSKESFYSNLSDAYIAIASLLFLILAVNQFAKDREKKPSK